MNLIKVYFILSFLVFLFSDSSLAQISEKAEPAELLSMHNPKILNINNFSFTLTDSPIIRDTRIFDINGKRLDKINSNSSPETYVYEGYDKDGNSVGILGAPTKEFRYQCPVCNGARVIHNRDGNVCRCWRCNGNGYLVSNASK